MLYLVIVILLLVNGLFVMAEMAMVSCRRSRLQGAAEKGDRTAQILIELIDHPNRYLSTIQLAITVSGIGLGILGEDSIADRMRVWLDTIPSVARYSHIIATLTTVIVLTFVSLVFAELVPKRLGQMFPEPLARAMALPMHWLSRISTPLVTVLGGLTDAILWLVPIRPKIDDQAAEEEVKAILASGAETGIFNPHEQQIVNRVFDLSDRKVRSIMVPRTDIVFLDIADTTQRIRVAVATSSHSHFPVCDGDLDHLVGFVHIKDLVKHGLIADELSLKQLVRKPMFVPESATALKLLDRFKSTGTHLAFVVDEYGVLVGLVTLNDLIENMLGDISAAGAKTDPMVVRRSDGSFLLDGMLSIAELKQIMEIHDLPREELAEFDTLGGFILTYLGRIPAMGDRVEFDRFTFEVMDMDRTRVDRVLLTIATPADDAAGEDI